MGMMDYDREAAFSSIHNMSNLHYEFNMSNNSAIANMTNVTAMESPETGVKALFVPINEFWASAGVWGSYFYVGLIIFTVGSIYAKSQNLFRSSIAMLLMSLIVAVPGTSGAFYIPFVALHTLYVFTGIAIAGVLYSMWAGE